MAAALSLAGCKWSPDDSGDKTDPNSDIENALGQLPDVHVLLWTDDGLPTYMVGEMATVGAMDSDDLTAVDSVLRPQMSSVLAPMRLKSEDLVVARMSVDDDGNRFVRYSQKHNGLDVVGGELIVQVSSKGSITSVNGTARGDISEELGSNPISQSTAVSVVTGDYRFTGMSAASPRLVYIQLADGTIHKAYETTVTGARGLDPVRDRVYVDLDGGAIIADYPQIHFAESRKVYTANNTTTTPGTLKRSEGGAATGDSAIDGAYDGTGDTWEMYHNRFNRDSFDNAGATLISTVHYDVNYCNAFWDGTQMTYGDGDPSQGCSNLAQSIDVTAHELTHAVTERTSGLVYSGESGGMNESMSDTLGGSQTEAFVNGGKNGTLVENAGTFLVGETVLPPFLRNQCDPAADGASADVWSSSVGGLDPHYSSGPPNLVGCLMAHGGMHPRGKTTVMVPAIGMDKMERIWYKANTELLTSNATYKTFATAAVQAAAQLGYDQATQDAVNCAFAAINTP
ncbi:MAG TPA: M4 family metallopeptidase, partial [Kofleriaceae bacterium]|nr:M4 family metallopeptidase [Kofleriaceae bacterium]